MTRQPAQCCLYMRLSIMRLYIKHIVQSKTGMSSPSGRHCSIMTVQAKGDVRTPAIAAAVRVHVQRHERDAP